MPDGSPITRIDGYAPIGDYAVLGDGRTIALVARDGAIDWLPLPTLDQDAAFGAILDASAGGSFRLAPQCEFRVRRRYRDGTNVLETTFTTDDGTIVVTDALTTHEGSVLPWIELVRKVECTSGHIRLAWRIDPRFGYGREHTEVREIGGILVALGKRLRLAVFSHDLGTPRHAVGRIEGAVDLVAGQCGLLVSVATDREPIPCPAREDVERRLDGTTRSWRRWSERVTHTGRWPEAVARSALALKTLVFAPTGALCAAGTTGLPEKIGGARNWDYRFAWVRDAAFTLDALARLGYTEQVHASLSWLLNVTDATHPRSLTLFGLNGDVPRRIEELPLAGYRGSLPVKRGNGAYAQLQLGNFGYLFETVSLYVEHGNALDPATAVRMAEMASFLCEIWRNADSGIWELHEKRQYTASKLQCWNALQRAADLASRGQIPDAGAERWLDTAREIREFVDTRCWSDAKRSYTFHADGDGLDCAVLLGLHHGFVDPQSERNHGTMDAIRADLTGTGPLLYRYSGASEKEGCFLACSFWLVTALAAAGRLAEAREMMDELVALGNDVGLYAEEMDPQSKEQLGNFPQALTHLSLIRAACAIADAEQEEKTQ